VEAPAFTSRTTRTPREAVGGAPSALPGSKAWCLEKASELRLVWLLTLFFRCLFARGLLFLGCVSQVMTTCPGTAFSAADVPRPKDLRKAFQTADVDTSGVVGAALRVGVGFRVGCLACACVRLRSLAFARFFCGPCAVALSALATSTNQLTQRCLSRSLVVALCACCRLHVP
jgi:hypothetical protein